MRVDFFEIGFSFFMKTVANLFFVSAFADSSTDRETWREILTLHPSFVYDEEAGVIDTDTSTTPPALAQLLRLRLAWNDEEDDDDDEEYLNKKSENRWLARKVAFALTCFFFTGVMLPILVSHGIVRIT